MSGLAKTSNCDLAYLGEKCLVEELSLDFTFKVLDISYVYNQFGPTFTETN